MATTKQESENSQIAGQNGEEFTKPLYDKLTCRYNNPWKTWKEPKFADVMKFVIREKDSSNIPNIRKLDETLPIVVPDYEKLKNPPKSGIQMMWIGHASVLVQFDGISVLTDPVFSQRCAPTQWFGPKRYRNPPCKIEELPHVDAVVISHNHYDHLDYGSVQKLNSKFNDKLWWYVPVGTKQWMLSSGCKNVVELTWWEESQFPGNSGITFACTPSQHWCRRGIRDTNKALWGSWIVKGPNHSFFFAGDTGYCEGFKQIGKRYGPTTLAAIPIGAYNPRWFMSPQHVDPAEAVQIHEDVKAKYSLGIHWGTFKLTYEHYLEPKSKLLEALAEKNLIPDCFFTLKHGEVKTVGGDEDSKTH